MKTDIQFQIECLTTELIEMLIDEYGWSIERAIDELYTSETFHKLNGPKCGLYYESAVYVYSFLKNEIETGKLA